MTTNNRDHGVADLMFLLSVRERVLAECPHLGDSLRIDPTSPRMVAGRAVLEKGLVWSISGGGPGVVFVASVDEASHRLIRLNSAVLRAA